MENKGGMRLWSGSKNSNLRVGFGYGYGLGLIKESYLIAERGCMR